MCMKSTKTSHVKLDFFFIKENKLEHTRMSHFLNCLKMSNFLILCVKQFNCLQCMQIVIPVKNNEGQELLQ